MRNDMNMEDICHVFQSKDSISYENACNSLVEKIQSNEITLDFATQLTKSIVKSGEQLLLPIEFGPYADVPSTGGPASLTTLLCPLLVAAEGVGVPKISATGSVAGAIDSMKLLPGYRTDLTENEFVNVLQKARFAHIETTDKICPADHTLIEVRRKKEMMANPWLAAISLLAKKLAVPGTAAAFDFRVGPSGNIGTSEAEAEFAANLFKNIASRLNIKIAVVLTDNATFQCSALGRLESLMLLNSIVENDPLVNKLDIEHLDVCVKLSALAVSLTNTRPKFEIENSIRTKIKNKTVFDVLSRHVGAQGSDMSHLGLLTKIRNSQQATILTATGDGFWNPPDIEFSKKWIKTQQATVNRECFSNDICNQIGLRLLTCPGERVRTGQNVIEIRGPSQIVLSSEIREKLRGSVTSSFTIRPQLIKMYDC